MSKPKLSKSRNNMEFIDSQYMNDQTYNDYLDRFKKIALSIFEWVNLPDSMDSRYLEKSLYYDGVASLLRGNTETIKGYINTRCCPSGYVNIYGLPTSLNCWSYSYQEQRKLFTGTVPEGLSEQQLEAYRNSNAVLVLNNWDYAEPGILYWSNIETYNLLQHDNEFSYAGVNPCAVL